ncbi:MAG TPA: aldo/keto reductase [Spirochaetia bacterium]|nr:aldo/keto reductase [Spirochaetia bacterium]
MTTRRLGRTDIEITPVGLGCWQFAQGSGLVARYWEAMSAAAIQEVVAAAREAGIGWFDTAEAYGKGTSEQMLSRALQALGVKPGATLIATKWMPFLRTARSIGSTIERRLECLRPFPIDLHQIHQPASFSSIPSQMKAMARLVKAHQIRSVGVSNFSAAQMEAAHAALAAEGVALASNQVRFNLLDRRIERNGVLASAKKLGVTIIAYSPLAQGILSGKFHDDPGAMRKASGLRRMVGRLGPRMLESTRPLVEELRAIARSHGTSLTAVALAWEIDFHGETVVVIPGASRPAQVRDAAAAGGLTLSARELARLDELSRPR